MFDSGPRLDLEVIWFVVVLYFFVVRCCLIHSGLFSPFHQAHWDAEVISCNMMKGKLSMVNINFRCSRVRKQLTFASDVWNC